MSPFQAGLQTHFPNGRVESRFLEELAPRVWWMRMDVQHAGWETSLAIYRDILAVGRTPLVTVWSSQEVEWFPAGTHFEYQNERSIKLGSTPAIRGREYRRAFDEDFYPAVQQAGGLAYYGAAANFEDRDLNWYADGNPQTLPADVRFTIHHYWEGGNLQARLTRWRQIIGFERLWLISEFGAQGLSDADRTRWLQGQWPFWAQQPNCLGAIFYQIFDSPIDDHDFGLYDDARVLKQDVFETFPLVQSVSTPVIQESEMQATFVIRRTDLIPNGAAFTVRYPSGADTVMSVQPDGTLQTRPLGTTGPWETAHQDGTRLVFRDVDGKAFAFPLVD